MGTTIGTLDVAVRANMDAFNAGLQKAGGMISSFGSSIGGMFGGFLNPVTALTGAALAAGTGLAVLVSKSMESIDVLAKMADTTGTTTQNLQAFQLSADLAGVSIEGSNKALEVFTKNLGIARAGAGSQRDAFSKLGLDMNKLATMDSTDAIGLVADEINKLPTAADKAAASFEIFGKQGQKMQAFLAGGSEGMRQARLEAERLGLTVGRDQAAQVERANDAWTRAKAALTGVGDRLAVLLAPAIEKAAELFTGFSQLLQRIVDDLHGVTNWLGLTVETIDGLNPQPVVDVASQVEVAESATKDWEASIKAASDELDKLRDNYISMTNAETKRKENIMDRLLGIRDSAKTPAQKIKDDIIDIQRTIEQFTGKDNEIVFQAKAALVVKEEELKKQLEEDFGKSFDEALGDDFFDNVATGEDKFKDLAQSFTDEFMSEVDKIDARLDQLWSVKDRMDPKEWDRINEELLKRRDDALEKGTSGAFAKEIALSRTAGGVESTKPQRVEDPENKKHTQLLTKIVENGTKETVATAG